MTGTPSPAFTFIEVLLALAIVAVLAALAYPNFRAAREQARIAEAVTDIRAIESRIASFELQNRALPQTLSQAGWRKNDPWGRSYRYLPFNRLDWVGRARLDRFRVPINSTYDLYSMGPDHLTVPPLVLPPSWDDIVRANDGGFVGLASRY